jgi:hypothetical protein
MAMETMGEHRRGSAGRDASDVAAGRPVLVHYVVARQGNKGLEVLCIPLEGKGETLPVFTAGWAARGYLFAGLAPGGGWYVRACTPGELVSLLVGLYAGVAGVALDPRPGRIGGEAANVMPRENFVDYLLYSRAPSLLQPSDFETIGGAPYGREKDLRGRQGFTLFTCGTNKDECERRSTADPTQKASVYARAV